MKKHDSNFAEPKMVLRWLFSQEDRLLTCGISIAGAAFDVITLPHWDVGHGSMERFTSARAALERHAEIAAALRADGWTPAAYTRKHPARARADMLSGDSPSVAEAGAR
jgi:hypothetical protein